MFHLALSGLRHYWKLSLCLGAGVFLASAILTGSLLVGDSVKATLRAQAEERVGDVGFAFVGGDRFFTEGLGGELASPVLFAPGTVSTPDKRKRANAIWIYGVEAGFWELAGLPEPPVGEFFAIGEPLAERLDLAAGDRINARMEMPGRVSREAPLSGETEKTASLGGKITHIVPSASLGRFSLLAQQTHALNVFVPLAALQEELEKPGRANLLLARDDASGALLRRLEGEWGLADAELKVRPRVAGGFELVSERVFVSDESAAAVRAFRPKAEGVLSYLINRFEANAEEVPYSVATGIGPEASEALAGKPLADNEILINAWLADQGEEGGLGLNIGDTLTLSFFEVADSREFVVRGDGKNDSGEVDPSDRFEFKVAGIVPMDHPLLRDGWVPDFPGLDTADSLADWESGMPLDTTEILGPDEKYWDDYRATPKAFISLAAAEKLWGNRFGHQTALRFTGTVYNENEFEQSLRNALSLTDLGMSARYPQQEAAQAVAGALDFGALFGSLSGFLIISALLLVSLLCALGMEARANQIGVLGAMGFGRGKVRRLFMWEAGLVAALGALLGALGGVIYTKIALWALGGVWEGASAGMSFVFHARPLSLVAGALGTLLAAMLAIWLAGRRISALPPRQLLGGDTAAEGSPRRRGRMALGILVAGVLGAALAMVVGRGLEGEKLAGAFFGAGFALLLAGLAGFSLLLRCLEKGIDAGNLAALGRRNAVRKRGRSLAVTAMVGCGLFLVAAVNAFRLKTDDDPSRLESGTGGFEFIGATTLPIYDDINDPEIRDRFGIDEIGTDQLRFVPLRQRSGGEEASCLNLNYSAMPRVLGVNPSLLSGRFRFASTLGGLEIKTSAWELLSQRFDDGAIPVIGDKASVMWALKEKLGGTIAYPDGRGGEVGLRIVALLENSTLQGNLLISETLFKELFPDSGGFSVFLVDAVGTAEQQDGMIGAATRALENRGAAFERSDRRLAAYASVQNTYISIFSVLGGLGVLLGTVGVGLVIARNVLERRAELGVLNAVGFQRSSLLRMVLDEHVLLVIAGVIIGAAAASVAVAPNLVGRAAGFPGGMMLVIAAAIAAAGVLFCLLATRLALRGSLLDAIRSE